MTKLVWLLTMSVNNKQTSSVAIVPRGVSLATAHTAEATTMCNEDIVQVIHTARGPPSNGSASPARSSLQSKGREWQAMYGRSTINQVSAYQLSKTTL